MFLEVDSKNLSGCGLIHKRFRPAALVQSDECTPVLFIGNYILTNFFSTFFQMLTYCTVTHQAISQGALIIGPSVMYLEYYSLLGSQ